MNEPAWQPVVLVVLGAVLAIATQLVAEFARHRNEDRRATRTARLDIYTQFLVAMGARDEDEERESAAVSALRLVAPDDTRLAAGNLWTMTNIYREARDQPSHMKLGNRAREATEAAAARREFTALAQRDLGITDLWPSRRDRERSEAAQKALWE